tara:strand:- start:267 stop:1151 length:885 start_codon:yes stop_codon:yes gene_type:complete
MQRFYHIELSDIQKEKLTIAELAFVKLFNTCRWAYTKQRHPIDIFRNFKNPKNHNLLQVMETIQKYFQGLMKSGKQRNIWRELDWESSFQAWILRMSPVIDMKELAEPIHVTEEHKPRTTQQFKLPKEDEIDKRMNVYEQMEFVLSDTELKKFKTIFDYLIKDFRPQSINTFGNLYFNYHYESADYMKELLLLRIDTVTKRLENIELDTFLAWCLNNDNQCSWLLVWTFCNYFEGVDKAEKNLTKTSFDEFFKLGKYKPEPENKIIKNDYMHLSYDSNKVYSLRDIRRMVSDDG